MISESTLKKMLIIAYSAGYDSGHHHTVDGCYEVDWGDEDAFHWLSEGDCFLRDINIGPDNEEEFKSLRVL